MPLSEEASDEIEALQSIFGPEDFEQPEDDVVQLRVVPEASEGRVCDTALLKVTFPASYPESAAPGLCISGDGLSRDAIDELQAVAEREAAEGAGMVVVFTVAEAVRSWLQEHDREAPPPPPEPEVPEGDADDDDFDVDSSDLDGEMIEALQEVLAGDSEKLKELKRIKKLSGKEQRTELRMVLKSLTTAQREALVGSDSDSSDDEQAQAPAAKKKAAPAPVKLPPCVIECPEGHELTAYCQRPPDYKGFDGDEYTCDVCGRDAFYKAGVYHCTKCFAKSKKQFDACPTCGSTVKPKGGGGKKQKNNKKK